MIARLRHAETFACATLERKVLELLGGDCTMPFGAYACYQPALKKTEVSAVVLDYEGKEVRVRVDFDRRPEDLDIESSAQTVFAKLQSVGVEAVLQRLKQKAPDMGILG